MRQSISLTTRLAILFALTSSAVLLVLGLIIGAEIERHFEMLDAETLRGKLALAQRLIERVSNAQELHELPGQLNDAFIGHHGLSYQLVDTHGNVLVASGGSDLFPSGWRTHARAVANAKPFSWVDADHTYHGLAATVPSAISGAQPLSVAVAIDSAEHQIFMSGFDQTLWLFMVGAAGLSGLLGLLVVRRCLSPLRAMRERAASITAQKLDRRLPADAVPKELADLALTFNDMLERLEDAFQRLSHFSSDIAHELRTPVSNLMTQTQVCLSRTRDAESYRAVLESNVEELERLSHMISQMLYLAKAENGLLVPDSEEIDLARLVRDLFEFYDALADECGVQLVLNGEADIAGDRLMLRRAVSNLLSNALRHAYRGTAVTVDIADLGPCIELSVENRGETIAPHHLAHIFDRFYRADPARHHGSSDGAGLGLAITRAIVTAHSGQVTATSSEDVTRVVVRLPRLPAEPAARRGNTSPPRWTTLPDSGRDSLAKADRQN